MTILNDINESIDRCYSIRRRLVVIEERLNNAAHASNNDHSDTAIELLNHAKDDLDNIGKTP